MSEFLTDVKTLRQRAREAEDMLNLLGELG